MKKLIITTVALIIATVLFANPPDVNEKVLKAFNETFKNVSDVKWHEYDHYYEVNFKQPKVMSRIRYDMDGNMLGTTRYYSGEQLTPNILASLKNKYPGKTIFGVTEISSESDLEYSIVLQDEKKWYIVSSDAFGTLSTVKRFNKAEPN